MRLLLDEHFSPEIARQLRSRGHDVVGVKERAALIGRSDRVQFALAPEERRAIATQDVADYRPLLAAAMRSGAVSYGIVCLSARRFRLRRQDVGRLVAAFDELLRAHPGDEDLAARGGEVWLVDASGG